MIVYLILKVYRGRAVGITRLNRSDLLLLVWLKSKFQKIKLDIADELLACILDAAVRTKKCQDHLRPKVRYLRTRVA